MIKNIQTLLPDVPVVPWNSQHILSMLQYLSFYQQVEVGVRNASCSAHPLVDVAAYVRIHYALFRSVRASYTNGNKY